ncbi:MAG: Lrp/AsnC family transcriptional regulator [Methanobacteriota archaeon]
MARPELDELDMKILASLNENARKSFRDMAKELGVSLSTVSNRVHHLEQSGIVSGYIPVVDAHKVGYDLNVVIGVRILHGKLLDVQKRIAKVPEVYGVYDVTGEWDSIILARFRNREDMDVFIKNLLAIEHVERTFTQLVLNTVKEEKRVLPPS